MNKPGLQNIVSVVIGAGVGSGWMKYGVLSEQTWELVLLLAKAEHWDYLGGTHECGTVGSDNLKGANLGEGRLVCVRMFELARANLLGGGLWDRQPKGCSEDEESF